MRLPVLPTLVVAAAVAVMIGLGVWQLERGEWKGRMLTELAAAPSLPALDLDDPTSFKGQPLAFRRATVRCTADAAPEVRAGRNRAGDTGYRYLAPCVREESGLALTVDVGWSKRPDALARVRESRVFSGTLSGATDAGAPLILTADQPVAPLEASKPPSIDDIPNNHLFYAFQWFFFAAAAAVIYLLALRRRAHSRG